MPYALVPRDYILKKVTAQQKAAVDAKRSHDNVNTFLDNETTPLLIGGAALAAVTPLLVNMILELIPDLSDKQKDVVKKGITQGALPGLLAKEFEKTGQALAPIAKFFRIRP